MDVTFVGVSVWSIDLELYRYKYTLPETNIAQKWMVGKQVSFWDGFLAGAMLVSGSVVKHIES